MASADRGQRGAPGTHGNLCYDKSHAAGQWGKGQSSQQMVLSPHTSMRGKRWTLQQDDYMPTRGSRV